jgi:hypothetical protein
MGNEVLGTRRKSKERQRATTPPLAVYSARIAGWLGAISVVVGVIALLPLLPNWFAAAARLLSPTIMSGD